MSFCAPDEEKRLFLHADQLRECCKLWTREELVAGWVYLGEEETLWEAMHGHWPLGLILWEVGADGLDRTARKPVHGSVQTLAAISERLHAPPDLAKQYYLCAAGSLVA